eukprot:5002058-Prymnesium_polylepis.1
MPRGKTSVPVEPDAKSSRSSLSSSASLGMPPAGARATRSGSCPEACRAGHRRGLLPDGGRAPRTPLAPIVGQKRCRHVA